MKKIRCVMHTAGADSVVETLQHLGVMELTEVTDPDVTPRRKTKFEIDHQASQAEHVVSFLSTYQPHSLLSDLLEQGRVSTSEREMEQLMQTFDYRDLIERSSELIEKIHTSEALLEQKKQEREELKKWQGWHDTLSSPTETGYTETLFLSGNKDTLDSAEEEMNDYPFYAPLRSSDTTLALVYLKEDQQATRSLVTSHKLDTVTLPERDELPEEAIHTLSREVEEVEKTLETLHKDAKHLSRHLPKLKVVSDQLHWRKEQSDVVEGSFGTEQCLVVEGWAPERSLETVRKRIEEKTELFDLYEIDPTEDEEPPVEIENNAYIRPFESVTRLYGLPGTNDLDPTPYFAGFFFVFFGICLSDVGYGLVLSIISGSLLFFYNITGTARLFLQLFMAGGVSSLIAGLFFGGYFGVDIALLPEALQRIQYFDPIASPLPIFYFALALGVIQIITGIILDIVRSNRVGEFREGLTDQGPWLLLFFSLILWGAHAAEYIAGPDTVYTALILTSLFLIVATGGRTYPKLWQRVSMGVVSLYTVVNYLSDILSYSRLLALGLATSALAYSVNLIALIAYEGTPVVGIVVMVIVLVIGHSFNLGVNLLGSFIHTARLQFVEFFGKFIKGTGRVFTPFHREERNTILKN